VTALCGTIIWVFWAVRFLFSCKGARYLMSPCAVLLVWTAHVCLFRLTDLVLAGLRCLESLVDFVVLCLSALLLVLFGQAVLLLVFFLCASGCYLLLLFWFLFLYFFIGFGCLFIFVFSVSGSFLVVFCLVFFLFLSFLVFFL